MKEVELTIKTCYPGSRAFVIANIENHSLGIVFLNWMNGQLKNSITNLRCQLHRALKEV
jgi:hypothetical protein